MQHLWGEHGGAGCEPRAGHLHGPGKPERRKVIHIHLVHLCTPGDVHAYPHTAMRVSTYCTPGLLQGPPTWVCGDLGLRELVSGQCWPPANQCPQMFLFGTSHLTVTRTSSSGLWLRCMDSRPRGVGLWPAIPPSMATNGDTYSSPRHTCTSKCLLKFSNKDNDVGCEMYCCGWW